MTNDALATRPRGARDKGRKRGTKHFVRDVLIILLIAIIISFLIKTYLVRSFYIPSASMENTLQIDDRIVVNELEPALIPVQRGDIVVFRDPGGWLPSKNQVAQNPIVAGIDWALSLVGLSASDANDHLIKRVIGLPGDHVTCCTSLGQITINGAPIHEPYVLLPPGQTAVSHDPFDVVVPPKFLWVLGDSRYNSKDSRYNRERPGGGFVPIDNVVGRAIFVSWPISRWKWLDNYADAFSKVGSPDGGVPSAAAPH